MRFLKSALRLKEPDPKVSIAYHKKTFGKLVRVRIIVYCYLYKYILCTLIAFAHKLAYVFILRHTH